MNNKLLKYANIFIYSIYLVSCIFFIFKKDFFSLFITTGCIIGTFILSIINKKYNKFLDNKLYIGIVVFIIMSALFGTCYDFYNIKYYDDFLHFISGGLSCVISWYIFNYFEIESKKKLLFLAIFAFMFNMGVASLWEIIEFLLDRFIGTHTQVGGLSDTVIDMIDALIGSIITIPFIIKYSKK